MINKLKILKFYIKILKKSEHFNERIHLEGDDVSYKSLNIDSAINYFRIVHNFLIIEGMFLDLVILCNKELNKNLHIFPIKEEAFILDKFHELYHPSHLVRFAIETFDSIEEVKIFIENNRDKVYDGFLKQSND